MIFSSPTVRLVNHCFTTRTSRTKKKLLLHGSYQFVYIGQPSGLQLITEVLWSISVFLQLSKCFSWVWRKRRRRIGCNAGQDLREGIQSQVCYWFGVVVYSPWKAVLGSLHWCPGMVTCWDHNFVFLLFLEIFSIDLNQFLDLFTFDFKLNYFLR